MLILEKDSSALLFVDVQEKLTPHVNHAEQLVSRCTWLMRLAQALEVPVLICEQYPSGLGQTVEPLRTLAAPYSPIEKVHFSCYRSDAFREQWRQLSKKQLVIAGIETHVCVLQTAIDMQSQSDHEIFVVVDAVSARSELDHKYGLKRMKQAGIQLVTSEMVFFEWVEQAGTKEFKTLSQAFLR